MDANFISVNRQIGTPHRLCFLKGTSILLPLLIMAVALQAQVTTMTGSAPSGYRNVAFWTEPGVQIAVSSPSFSSTGMRKPGDVCPLNRPFVHDKPESKCWITSRYQHLPQWAWIHFDGLRQIDKVVFYAGNLETRPIEFLGQYLSDDSDEFHLIFNDQQADFDPQTLSYTIHFKPIVTNNFRLLIKRNAARVTPQSWVTELAQVEVYGDNITNIPKKSAVIAAKIDSATLDSNLEVTKFVPEVEDTGKSLDIHTPWYRLVLDKSQPRILFLSWDNMGKGELSVNFLEKDGACPVLDPVFQNPMPLTASILTRSGNVFRYSSVEMAMGAYEQVSIRANERGFDLGLAAAANHEVIMHGGLFRFHFAAHQTPTTFVCHPSKIMNYVETPTYLVAPDFGTAYITQSGDSAAFYRMPDALFFAKTYWVDVTPHQPVTEDGLNKIGPKPWRTTLHFELQSPVPLPALVSKDPRLERFPKYSLNMVQWRPDTEIIGNSVMSVGCGLAMLFYAQQAVFVPHLKNGISPMALVGTSVERYFQGAPGYMMPDRNVCAPDWRSSRETPAYLIISAWHVICTIGGLEQLHKWLEPMECLANHIEADFGSDSLIYYPDNGHGSMWFDTYKFRGADAYSNAADYRAFRCISDLETLAGRTNLAKRYREDANRIEAVYFKSFYNPKTGVLAGWRTKDSTLHDYMFPWVNGFAICQGLVPSEKAKTVLQVLLNKLNEIGFHSYQLGLPTNLLPMSPDDYAPNASGAPKQTNGMDTWQVYMNGGATPVYAHYFIQALYQTGQNQEAERLLWPLMESYEKGTFNCGVRIRGQQRNPVGSAFYEWDGLRGRGEGYLPENWDGVVALFTGHYGIGLNKDGYYLERWSPLKGQKVKLDLPYMGTNVRYLQ